MSLLASLALSLAPTAASPTAFLPQGMEEVGGLARPVSAGRVTLHDGFWRERLRVLRTETLPLLREQLEERGLPACFDRVAEEKVDIDPPKERGQDAMLYAWIESVGHALLAEPGAKERQRLEDDARVLVERVVAAQRKDGYLHTPTQLDRNGKPFSDLKSGDEFFCAARMIEAGLAWEQATGDARLRAAGVRFAGLLEKRFGESRRTEIGGRPGLSFALAKLARVTERVETLDFAAALVERRGSEKRKKLFGIEWLDDLPPIGSKEARGPLAVAAALYAGLIEISTLTGWAGFEESSLSPAWDIARRKAQPSGAVGVSERGLLREGYDWKEGLPLASAGDTMLLLPWYRGLARATTHPLWFDEIERLWTNVSLAAVSPDGRAFPALPGSTEESESGGADEAFERLRLLSTVTEDIYFTDGRENVWLGLYASSETKLKLGVNEVTLRIESTVLDDGKVTIHVDPTGIARFMLHVRIPRWAAGKEGTCRLGINDSISKVNVDHGNEPGTFLTFERVWNKGDRFTLELPMEFRCEEAPPKFQMGSGRCVVSRGSQAYVLLPSQGIGDAPVPADSARLRLPSDGRPEVSPERLPQAPGVVLGRLEQVLAEPAEEGAEPEPVSLRFVPWWLARSVEGAASSLWVRRR